MDYFVLKGITNYDQTGDPRKLHYKWLFDVEEFTEGHLIEYNSLFIFVSLKWMQTNKNFP